VSRRHYPDLVQVAMDEAAVQRVMDDVRTARLPVAPDQIADDDVNGCSRDDDRG
jgi:hypothetical protein